MEEKTGGSEDEPLTFCLLADRPELCLALAEITYSEWPETWHGYGIYTAEAAAEYYREHCASNRTTLPLEILGVDSKGQLKCVSGLDKDDMHDGPYAGATPWLCSLWVSPDLRKRGVARRLEELALGTIKSLGFDSVYLWTPKEWLADVYTRWGWERLDTLSYVGITAIVMRKQLALPSLGSGSEATAPPVLKATQADLSLATDAAAPALPAAHIVDLSPAASLPLPPLAAAEPLA